MFGLFKTNRVESLKQKSDNVVNVFAKTITDLERVNSQINAEIKVREDLINKLTEEGLRLDTTRISNNKVISKINSFFND